MNSAQRYATILSTRKASAGGGLVSTDITVTFNGEQNNTLTANGNATINVAAWGVGQAGGLSSGGNAGAGGHGGDYAAQLNLSINSGYQAVVDIGTDYSSLTGAGLTVTASAGTGSGNSTADIVHIGGAGGTASTGGGGGGGGSGGPSNDGNAGASGGIANGGAGGAAVTGGGAGGDGGAIGLDGVAGTNPGGGGGGQGAGAADADIIGGLGRVQITGTMLLPPGSDSDDAFTVT